MKGQERITELHAFVVVDDDGTEGVTAFKTDDGWMPMVGADIARINSLRPMAQILARQLGKPIEVIRFTARETIEIIEP